MVTVRLKMSRSQLIERVYALPGILSGRSDNPEIARGFALRLATTAMGFIKPAYVAKARGGVDEAGEKWQPLAFSTIKRRMMKGNNRKITDRAKKAEREAKHAEQVMNEAPTFRKGLMAEAKLHGAKQKRARALTKYAQAVASIEILRDTGRLFNSLSPGYTGQMMPDGSLEVRPGMVTFGTNVKYAIFHHSDEPRKLGKNGKPKLPQRRLWPKPSKWPAHWWNQLRSAARTGIVRALELSLRAAA